VTRLALALVASLCCLPSVQATLSPRTAYGNFDREVSRSATAAASRARGKGPSFTDKTEVMLDGRACKYQDVPADAEVVLLHLTSDKKVILRIHFRTKR
jgi:hypothetical protein